jgi:hypothetical protein
MERWDILQPCFAQTRLPKGLSVSQVVYRAKEQIKQKDYSRAIAIWQMD